MNGIERIKILGKDIKEDALLEIINYLISREDMADKYLNEEKNLSGMIDFIRTKAKEKAINNMAVVKDEEVFGWAIHYFDESNADLGIKQEENKAKVKEEKKVENNEIEKNSKPSKKEWKPEGQLSLFDFK